MILADPAGSILAGYIETGTVGQSGSWAVEGIGEDFVPAIADLSRIRKAFTITDAESFEVARSLLREEGMEDRPPAPLWLQRSATALSR